MRTFGKQGDGPGELRATAALVVLPDGTAVIGDLGHRAFMMFGPDGIPRRSVPMGGDEGLTVLG